MSRSRRRRSVVTVPSILEREQDQLPIVLDDGHPCSRPGWNMTLLDGTLFHYSVSGEQRGWMSKSPTGTWCWCRTRPFEHGQRAREGECMTRDQAITRVERAVWEMDLEHAVEDMMGLTW